jgi:putative oxidoreductase
MHKESLGLLIIRIGVGLGLAVHGFPKISNPEMWSQIGGSMGMLGINFMPSFWGFCASFTEFFGGIMIAVGIFTRINSALMTFTMIIAALVHIKMGDDYGKYSHALKLAFVFLGLVFTGSGKYKILKKDW